MRLICHISGPQQMLAGRFFCDTSERTDAETHVFNANAAMVNVSLFSVCAVACNLMLGFQCGLCVWRHRVVEFP